MSPDRFYELYESHYLGGTCDFYTFYQQVMKEMITSHDAKVTRNYVGWDE